MNPLVLITEVPVNHAHGVGMLLLRLLPASGMNAVNIHPESSSSADASLRSIAIPVRHRFVRRARGLLQRAVERLTHQGPRHREPDASYVFGHDSARTMAGADLLLAVIYSPTGLHFLAAALEESQSRAPLLIWFLDCELRDRDLPQKAMDVIARHQPRFWAINRNVQETLEETLPFSKGRIEIHHCFGIELPQAARPEPAEGGAIRCAMIGNVWDTSLIGPLKKLWRAVREALPQVEPLSWWAHEEAMDRLRNHGVTLDGQIIYRGFAPTTADALDGVHAAIIPFSTAATADSNYARHSFPSRIADYCAHGVPVFALAADSSPLAGFIREEKIGIADDGSDPGSTASRLVSFLKDAGSRAECGRHARAAAERLFDMHNAVDEFKGGIGSMLPRAAA